MVRKRRRRFSEQELVEREIIILERKVQPRFNCYRKLIRKKIHEHKGDKYYSLFKRTIDYLEDLKGDNLNNISDMIEDYFMCVFMYYSQYSRIPYLTQLSPSPANQLRFEEWIYKQEREDNEEYFYSCAPPELEIIEVDIIPDNFELNFIEV